MSLQKDIDELVDALKEVLFDLHPIYANTSYRGRGVGGQAVTQQCSIVNPELKEFEQIERIETLLRKHLMKREENYKD